MATSTQMTPMRGGYSGAQADNGLMPLQQQVLDTISSCQDQHGININILVQTMGKRGHNDKNIRCVYGGRCVCVWWVVCVRIVGGVCAYGGRCVYGSVCVRNGRCACVFEFALIWLESLMNYSGTSLLGT